MWEYEKEQDFISSYRFYVVIYLKRIKKEEFFVYKKIVAIFVSVAIILTTAMNVMSYSTGDDYPSEYKNAALDAVVDRWNFYNRECTSFAAWCLNSRNGVAFTNQYKGASKWGNACTWGTVAKSLGITVDKNPAVGAIAWWNSNEYGAYAYGHVAWVKSVSGSNVTIEEYNWSVTGGFGTRTIPASNVSGYIHIKDIGTSSSTASTWVKTNKSSYTVGETVTFTFGYKYGTSVSLGIDKDGSRYATPEVTGQSSYSRSFSEAGSYSVYCSGWSQGAYEDSAKVTFTVTPNTYTVSYNANGGSGAPSNQTKTHGTNLTLSSTKPTRTGYTFKNWNTAASGSGTSYSAGGTYSANAAVTLYAQWTANTYTVTFNPGGGTTPTASKTVTYSSTYGALPTPTKTGHTFNGWYTAASGGTKITADTTVSITANQTLYAQWSVNSYEVVIYTNGGTYTDSTGEYTVSATHKLNFGESIDIGTAKRSKGYEFASWITIGRGTLAPYGVPLIYRPDFNNGSHVSTYGNVTHKLIERTSDLNLYGGQYMLEITATQNSAYGLGGFVQYTAAKSGGEFYHVIVAKIPEGYTLRPGANACGDGYKFEWLTDNQGTGQWETYVYKLKCGTTGKFEDFGYAWISGPAATEANPVKWYVGYSNIYDATGIDQTKNKFTSSDEITFILATWRANDYTIRYDANGGSGTAADTAARYGSAVKLAKNGFTKKYCAFKGWNTKADGSGTAYADGGEVQNLTAENGAAVTLYAQWEKTVYTQTAVTDYGGYRLCNVKIHGVCAPCKVILAAYKNGRLTSVQRRDYSQEEETFAVMGDVDTVKVMVWDDMAPVTEAEEITLK